MVKSLPSKLAASKSAAMGIAVAAGWVVVWLLAMSPLPAQATPPGNWEVMRVFVRDSPEQISRLVTRHYATVLLVDLARELAENDNLRKVSALETAALQDAIYVARLEGEMIVSDQSLWRVSGNAQAGSLELGKLSLALRAARGLLAEQNQLLDRAQFTVEGAIELPQLDAISEHWFGFSAGGRRAENLRRFAFQMPPATHAQLLLATPSSVVLSSNELVVEKLGSPTDVLPPEWPSLTLQDSNAGTQWWLVHLSGISRFELIAEDQVGETLTHFKHSLRSTTIDYIASERSLSTRGKFVVLPNPDSFPIRISVSPELKIEEVSVAGSPIAWQLEPSHSSEVQFIVVGPLPDSRQEITVEVRAQSSVNDWRQAIALPQLSIAESYSLDGVCRLSGEDGIVADRLVGLSPEYQPTIERLSTIALSSSPPTLTNSSNGASPAEATAMTDKTGLVWQARWLGNPPQLQGLLAQRRFPWTARTLTRIGVQAEWLSANCRLRLEAPRLSSNEIRLPIGNGWFIDSVRLIQNGNELRARVEDRQDAASPVIAITWEDDREQLELELEVVAHSPRDSSVDGIDLQLPRLVSVPHADQIDNYVVEPSSHFAVDLGARLLPFQRSTVDLPAWQQQLLPDQTERWIFQGIRGQIPPLALVGASGTFSARIATFVSQPLPDVSTTQPPTTQRPALTFETRIHCTPLSGSIDRLTLVIPQHETPHGAFETLRKAHWTLRQAGSEPVQLELTQPNEILSETEARPLAETTVESLPRVIELVLPNALSTPFTISSQIRIPDVDGPAPLQLPIVGIPLATPGSSTVLLPANLSTNLRGIDIDLLPVGIDSVQRFSELVVDPFSPWLDDAPTTGDQASDQRWVAARVDAGSGHLLQIDGQPLPVFSSWAWSELLQHRLADNGVVRHDCQWSIEAAQGKPIEFQLPIDWDLEQVLVDGQSVDLDVVDGKVSLELPLGRAAQVVLSCQTQRAAPAWLSYCSLERPRLSIPVLESRQTLAVPPTRFSLDSLLSASLQPSIQPGVTPKLFQRLLPSVWWSWLGLSVAEPTILDSGDSARNERQQARTLAGSAPATGWRLIELTDRGGANLERIGVWTMLRTALSAVSLAFVLAFATGFWILLARSIRAWWLTIAASAAALVLAPLWLLPLVQLSCLALLLAALLRMGWVVCRLGESQQRPRSRSSIIGPLHSSNTMMLIVAGCLIGGNGGTAVGQNSQPATATESTESTIAPAAKSPVGREAATGSASGAGSTVLNGSSSNEIFSVLIPINDAGEVSGAYAYAPLRLLELLPSASGAAAGLLPPRISSADYTLRMRRSLLGQPDQLQELSVDFKLLIPQSDVELRLPFNSSQLRLQRGSVGGQELLIGGRGLYQVGDAIAFRSSSVGSVHLHLQFEPRGVEQTTTQASLRCLIPPIPNATLRIVADSNSTFELGGDNLALKNLPVGSTELLGPASQLDLRWSTNTPRSNVGQIVPIVHSDTWLHARGDQVLAVCQLRIAQARSLPRELHLVAEPGWEPVGVHWQDGDLIANELSSLGGRRVYTIRCQEGWEATPDRVLRVLMVPRTVPDSNNDSGATMAIPFFTLREVSQQAVSRTLAWSAEPETTWRPEGLEYWQELPPVEGLQWGDFDWGVPPRLYRIAGSLSTTLHRVSTAPSRRVTEITEIHVGQQEIRINYRGQLTATSKPVLALSMPAAARLDGIRVDGALPNYRVSARGEEALIEIIPANNTGNPRMVEVDVSLPSTLNQAEKLPRLFLRDWEAISSVVRVQSGTGVVCHVDNTAEVALAPANVPPHQLLPQLESLVGQVDVGNQYRDQPWLPLEFTLRPRPSASLLGAVIAMRHADSGWAGTVRATWQCDDQPLDFAFFELPTALRDAVDTGKLPAQLVPQGDSSRMTLRVIPPPPQAGKTTVEFSFVLAGGNSSQTLSIPQISVIDQRPKRPNLALPNIVAGKAVQWIHTGRRLDELPAGLLDDNWVSDFQAFELETSQSQVSWQRNENAQQSAQLLLCHTTLLKREPLWIAGFVDYWIQPSGQVELTLAIPEECDVLGVNIGGQAAVWQLQHRRLGVLLQPNSLPTNVRLVLHWRTSDGPQVSFSIPSPLDASLASPAWQGLDSYIAGAFVSVSKPATNNRSSRIEFAQRWGEMLLKNIRNINDRTSVAAADWLQQWHPSVVGLDTAINLRDLLDGELLDAALSDAAAQDVLTPNSIWDNLWAQTQLRGQTDWAEGLLTSANKIAPSLDDLPNGYPGPSSAPHQQLVFTGGDFALQDLQLNTQPPTSHWSAQLTAATLLTIAALLIVVLAWRLAGPYARLLANYPWIYWLQLSALAWFILPATWPSWVLALTAIAMLISHSLEARRRTRLLSRV